MTNKERVSVVAVRNLTRAICNDLASLTDEEVLAALKEVKYERPMRMFFGRIDLAVREKSLADGTAVVISGADFDPVAKFIADEAAYRAAK